MKNFQDLKLNKSLLQEIQSPFLESAGVHLSIKREDLVDNELGGNKWRKLKYNIEAASRQNHHTLLTFGGAYSNHIYATAAVGKHLGFKTIGLIRGEQQQKLNPTLQFARDCGMKLEYVDRITYRNKTSEKFINHLHRQYGRFYLLPEGGSNALALKGCTEIVEEINRESHGNFNIVCIACGTGATLAGIIQGLKADQKAIGFPVLKGGEFLYSDINSLLKESSPARASQWQLNTDYHFGGYAKTTNELWKFIEQFEKDFTIPLDAVYTGKMFYGLFDLIKKGALAHGCRIVAVHTGGLQGNAGFNQKK